MVVDARPALLQAIVDIVADYEMAHFSCDHVDRWVRQFDPSHQHAILDEMAHVLRYNYISRQTMLGFLEALLHELPNGSDPRTFWQSLNFLRLPGTGRSQSEMLNALASLLEERLGLSMAECGSPTGPYLYLDDVLYTGQQLLRTLGTWLQLKAPAGACVVVAMMATHTYGDYAVNRKLMPYLHHKQINLHWFRGAEIENRLTYRNEAEVLWPTVVSDDRHAQWYLHALTAELGYQGRTLMFREPRWTDSTSCFSSERGRQLLEDNLLRKGAYLTSICKKPAEDMRPLGYTNLGSFGFGALCFTYRNCPNNCPLAFWWGGTDKSYPLNQWYPLFPRRERASRVDREFASMFA